MGREYSTQTAKRAVAEYKSARFRYAVLPQYDLSPTKGWKKEAKKLGMLDTLLEEVWPTFSIDCQLIIGTFVEDGSAHLFHVRHDGFVDPVVMPWIPHDWLANL